MHPKDRRTLLIVFGSISAIFFVGALLVAFVLPSGGKGWVAKVVVLDQSSVCVVAANGANVSHGHDELCLSRGGDEVEPAWSDLQLGGCVGVEEPDEHTVKITDVLEPNTC